MFPRAIPFLILLLAGLAYADGSTTQGGNLTALEFSMQNQNTSAWHGVVGQASPAPAVPFTINATPGNLSYVVINTGSGSLPYGLSGPIFFLFSNSTAQITSLSPGNLSLLDQFMATSNDNATATFTATTGFTMPSFTVPGVPTAYTYAPNATAFRMGYLQDQAGDIVIAVQVVNQTPGFDGSPFDFQFMLPVRNGTAMPYYLTVLISGNVQPPAPSPVPPPAPVVPAQGNGGGSRTPYYPEKRNVTANLTPVTPCISEIYCGEWGPCIDGFSYQVCSDLANCAGMQIYRSERCITPPGGLPAVPPPEKIVPIIVGKEFPCVIFILLVVLSFIVLFHLHRRRKRYPPRYPVSTR